MTETILILLLPLVVFVALAYRCGRTDGYEDGMRDGYEIGSRKD